MSVRTIEPTERQLAPVDDAGEPSIKRYLARHRDATSTGAALAIFLGMLIYGQITYGGIIQHSTISNLLINNAHLVILAVGLTFVILTGGIDLSVGAVIAFSSVVGVMLAEAGWNPYLVVLVMVLIGSAIGLGSGVLIEFFDMQPFIATLSMMFLARGLASTLSTVPQRLDPDSPIREISHQYKIIDGPKVNDLATTPGVMLAAAIVVIGLFLLHRTRFGRTVYAVGGSEPSAELMGLPVRSTKLWVYVISGTLAAVAGVVYTSRLGSAQNITGIGWELDAIAAVVIGGTLLTGGSGSLIGSVIGAFVLGLMNVLITRDGGIRPEMTTIITGGILLLFVLLQRAIPRQTAMTEPCVIGVDYGTLSGRAIVVRVRDGAVLGSVVHEYRHAVMDRELAVTGAPLPPEWALQDPDDYREVLRTAVPAAVADAGIDPRDVIGIATDFTASSPLPALGDGTPLCELAELRDRRHAYVKLWKHHAAQAQADRINAVAAQRGEPWLPRYGGSISSEWEYAKALQLLEEDPEIYERMDHWVEAADWIVWQLCGRYVRNACTAGYKGIWQDGAYPSPDFERALNPAFAGFAKLKLDHPIGRLGDRAGGLTARAAAWTGLPAGIAVAVGNVDAHVTAPAARAIDAGQMLAIMGTSTCHVMNHDRLVEVPGMCGVVDGGIVAGSYGYEAGQSGVGDIFAWYVENQVPGRYVAEAKASGVSIHRHLTDLAFAEQPGAHGLVALDWLNGNRSVLVDASLSGLLLGQTLSTRADQGYRALLEATAFGARMIVESFGVAGVPVREYVVAGGLLQNRPLMQLYSDVLRLPISTIASEQGPALGSAIHAAVAAGAYPDVHDASEAMGRVERAVYTPDPFAADVYDRLYEEYRLLHDHFGRGANDVMKRLRRMRQEALA